jgi:nickel-type superoxide dismutase maturation protease
LRKSRIVAGRWLRRVVVDGDSMAPALVAGDRLLVVRIRRARPGQVVVVTDPRQPDRLLVKRVTTVTPTSVEVRGDNADASTDSRQFGAVPRARVWGRVLYRYAPTPRAGRVH